MSKPGPKPEWDNEIEAVLRHWPYLPDYVRRTFVEISSHYGPPAVTTRFPTPPGITWGDIEIVLLSPEEAKIIAGDVTQCYTFAALGLADLRRPDCPRTEWRMLQTYAENPEPDAYFKLPKRNSLKLEISKFRRWLQCFFGLADDPLRPFKPALWLPRFKVRADY